MVRLPFMQLWISDFVLQTGHLSLAECGAFIRLITLCWQQPRCRLRDDEEWILQKLRASDTEAASATRKVLSELFVKKRGYWENVDLSAQYIKASDKSDKNTKSGRKGGNASARKRRDILSSTCSDLPAAESQEGSSKLAPEPKPNPESRELSKPAFLEKLKRVIGPGARPSAVDGCWSFVEECISAGASEGLILRIVEKQTKASRPNPIRSLRALASEIDAAIKMQAPAAEHRVAAPMQIPQGRAGDCLREIIATYGESAASAWFREAEWTDDEVVLPNDFARSQVDSRFGAVLQRHGFKVTCVPMD